MVRRLQFGPLAAYLEPRDLWVGAYVATDAVYVCPLPCVVLRWARRRPVRVIDRVQLDGTMPDGSAHFRIIESHTEYRR